MSRRARLRLRWLAFKRALRRGRVLARERLDIIRVSITDIFRPGSVGRARTRLALAKIREYNNLKEIIGSQAFQMLSGSAQQVMVDRYYDLCDDVGIYADQVGFVSDDRELIEKMYILKMMGRNGIWDGTAWWR